MKITTKSIIFLWFALSACPVLHAQTRVIEPPKPDTLNTSATQSPATQGVLNAPEIRAYHSDFFPLSLSQRGRMATAAYRGMPPGFFEYEYAGNRLSNPVTGFWNEQWLPYHQIDERHHRIGDFREAYEPPVPVTVKPISRIFFSQDYTVNLSLLDLSFTQKISKTNYVQLSGSNFLSDGSEQQDFSVSKVNTYRAQVHLQGQRWQMDSFYWQMRHRFNMSPETGFTRDKFKQIGHFAWFRLQGKFGNGDSLVITPGYTNVEDDYTRAFDRQRDNRYQILRLGMQYLHKAGGGFFGVKGEGNYVRNVPNSNWVKSAEIGGDARLFYDHPRGNWQLRAEAGSFFHSDIDASALGSLSIKRKLGSNGAVGVGAFYEPQATPALWRHIAQDSIPAYASSQPMIRQSVYAIFKTNLARGLSLQIEPFAMRMENYPDLSADRKSWNTRNIENYGLRGKIGLKFWRFFLVNDLTYHAKYKEAYAPQINNVTTLKTSIYLFKNALRLDGILTWRYIGDFQTVEFDRLLNYYRISSAPNGRLNIGDARIQAQFRNATVFFIWENLRSEDYFIVNNTLESLLIFRLGVDWFLFN